MLARQDTALGEEGRPAFRFTTDGDNSVEWIEAAWEGTGAKNGKAPGCRGKHPARSWVLRSFLFILRTKNMSKKAIKKAIKAIQKL